MVGEVREGACLSQLLYSLSQKYRRWLLGAWPAGPYSLRDTGPETQLRVRGEGRAVAYPEC